VTWLPDDARKGRREGLEALRDVLTSSILAVDPVSRAPLARQLTIVLEQLDNLPGGEESNPVDEVAKRRAERRANAQGQ
jgi:hypothetical protein